jgi:hypothetical protein
MQEGILNWKSVSAGNGSGENERMSGSCNFLLAAPSSVACTLTLFTLLLHRDTFTRDYIKDPPSYAEGLTDATSIPAHDN